MSFIIKGVELILLFFSIYGYFQHLRNRMNTNFVPAIFCCFITVSMVLAGILNVLKVAQLILLSTGLVFAFLSIRKGEKPRDLICPGITFFLCVWLFYLVILYGTRFSHYDNFSHWGLVAEKVLKENRFPNFMDKQISFQAYPLGSAAFLYFFAKAVSSSEEWVLLWVQMGMTLSMASALFAFSRNWIETVLTALTVIILIGGNTAPDALLVDTLLPMIALAGMAMCIYGKPNFRQVALELLITNLCLVSVKNSGIFFAVLLLIYATWQNRKVLVRDWKMWAGQWLIPFGWMYLWKKHVALVFTYGLGTKHAMSISKYKAQLLNANLETIKAVSKKLFSTFFSLSNRFLYLLAFITLIGIINRCLKKERTASFSVIVILATAGYLVGLWGMYLLSMPQGEAMNLAGYDRYFRSILIFDAGLILMQTVIECGIDQEHLNHTEYLKSILCLLAVLITVNPSKKYYQRPSIDAARINIEQIISKYNVPAKKRYLLLVPENDGNYRRYITSYLLDSAEVNAISEGDLSDADVNWQEYDFVIDAQNSETTKQYLQQQFGRSDSVISLETQGGSEN